MTLNKYLKWTALASIFSVILIPFIVSNDMFFPFITGKGFFFRVLTEIGFAAWLLLSLRDPSVRPRKSFVLWALVAFLGVIGLADLFGAEPWKSFWSNFERMEGYITLIHLFMWFIMSSALLSSEKLWRRFFESSLWASVAISLYGILQLSGKAVINQGGVRVDATFGNATYLAIYLIFHIFFAAILALREGARWKKVVYPAIAILHLAILYYTATRGAILGLIGGALLSALLIALFDRKEKKIRIAAASVVGAVVLLVIGFIAIRDTSFVAKSPVLQRFASISLADTKTQARAYIWPMAVEGFKERPILGWGQENFNYIFNERYDPAMYAHEQWFDHTHNIVLDWLVAGGILGLLAYLSLYVSAVYLLWRKTDLSFVEKALWTGLGAAYFFHNLFVFDNIVSYILFVSVLSFVHFKSTRLEKPVGEAIEEADGRMAGPAILLVLVFSLYFFNWRGYATNTSLIDGLRALATQPIQVEAAIAALEKSLSYDTLGRPEVVERLVDTARAVNSPSVPIESRQRYFDVARAALEKQVERFPGDARYELFAGNFYTIYGLNEQALLHLENAAKLSPNKQSILFQLGAAYIATKQYEKGVEVFKRAYDLEPSYSEALSYYAASLVYAGREAEAQKLFQESGAGSSATEQAFLRAYADRGEWQKVIPMLRKGIEREPGNMEYRMNLVAAYYQSGNKTAAIAALREMIALDPSFKTQGEAYIKEIEAGR
ncbi:MAG: O-antigen ligase family protein [Candidatus Taylorbacteria bacterium]|nr:O-antigen ligase family protein [Candidatus Taylorbacteria bacterium]